MTKKMLLRSLLIAMLLVATGSTPVLADGGTRPCPPNMNCTSGIALFSTQLNGVGSQGVQQPAKSQRWQMQ